jgi:hypothetical protein
MCVFQSAIWLIVPGRWKLEEFFRTLGIIYKPRLAADVT